MCARDSDECDIGGMQIVSPNGSTKLAYGFVSGVFGCAATGNNDEVSLSHARTRLRVPKPTPMSVPAEARTGEVFGGVCLCWCGSGGWLAVRRRCKLSLVPEQLMPALIFRCNCWARGHATSICCGSPHARLDCLFCFSFSVPVLKDPSLVSPDAVRTCEQDMGPTCTCPDAPMESGGPPIDWLAPQFQGDSGAYRARVAFL